MDTEEYKKNIASIREEFKKKINKIYHKTPFIYGPVESLSFSQISEAYMPLILTLDETYRKTQKIISEIERKVKIHPELKEELLWFKELEKDILRKIERVQRRIEEAGKKKKRT